MRKFSEMSRRRIRSGDDPGARQPVNPANARRLANGTRRRHEMEQSYATRSSPEENVRGPRNSRKTRNRRCAANKNHRNPVKMRSRQRREEDGDDLVAQQPVNPANAQRLANGTRWLHEEELRYATYSTPSKHVQGPANHAKNTEQASRRKRHRRQKNDARARPTGSPRGCDRSEEE